MKTLQALRAEVDQIDKIIIEQLAQRDLLSSEIGRLKRQEKQKIRDIAREEALEKKHISLAKSHGLDPLFIQNLFAIILRHSRKIQKRPFSGLGSITAQPSSGPPEPLKKETTL